MKRILLTGCNGQLGRAIQDVYKDTVHFILTDALEPLEGQSHKRLDIADLTAVKAICEEQNPDVIINCAAYTNVDGCEEFTDDAYRANAIGPRNLAIVANARDMKLIHVSTDYVFAGDGSVPYTEYDPPAPISAYGKTKLAGEEYVKAFCKKYFILRTAWLYGDGKNFIKTMLTLSKTHEKVSVVCDQKGSPTSANELAKMIAHLEPTEEYGIYHATCEGDTNWAQFTEEIFKRTKRSTLVEHVTSEEYAKMNPKSASRPKFSILDNYMLRLTNSDFRMAHWEDALQEYLDRFADEILS